MRVKITIYGCHDINEFSLMVDDKAFKLLELLEAESKDKSKYECMPYLEVKTVYTE